MDLPRAGVRLLGLRCESLSDAATTAVQVRLDEDVPVEFAGVRYAVSNGEVTRA